MPTTTDVAIYAAVVATISLFVAGFVAWLTFRRDRQRLRVIIGWFAKPRPGITVRCVNIGFRPVSVQNVYFTRPNPPARRSMRPVAFAKGEVGTAYGDDAPSPATPLPVRLDPADEATLHYELDDVFRQADGIEVLDTTGRSYTHKFAAPDRVGLAHVVASHAGWHLVTAERISQLAQDIKRNGEVRLHRELQQLADEAGPGGMIQLWVEDDEKAGTLRLRWIRPGQRSAYRESSLVRMTATIAGALASGIVVSIPLSAFGLGDVAGVIALLVFVLAFHLLGLRLTGVGLWPWARGKVDEEDAGPVFSELILRGR